MRLILFICVQFLFCSILFSGDIVFKTDEFDNQSQKARLFTYEEAEAYCKEDGDDYWIPHLALLRKLILVAELQHLDRWFWSSDEAFEPECDGESCHYQMHTKTMETRVKEDKDRSANGLCVYY